MRDSLGDWRCGSVKLFMSTRCWGDGPNPLFVDTPLRKGDFDVNIIVEPGKMQWKLSIRMILITWLSGPLELFSLPRLISQSTVIEYNVLANGLLFKLQSLSLFEIFPPSNYIYSHPGGSKSGQDTEPSTINRIT